MIERTYNADAYTLKDVEEYLDDLCVPHVRSTGQSANILGRLEWLEDVAELVARGRFANAASLVAKMHSWADREKSLAS